VAIWRLVRPQSYFNRNTSLIFRMDNLSAGISNLPQGCVERDPAYLRLSCVARFSELPPTQGGNLPVESVATFLWNQWQRWTGIRNGYSRDKRPDCKQVCIGLVVNRDGLPLGYEVFEGNRRDVTTLEEMVHLMEGKYGRAKRVWVFDRGVVSEENLEFLRERKANISWVL
jgi:hypothetical protein